MRRTTSWSPRTGHIYFTDPAFGEQADHRELDFYGVYHIPPKGPMKLVAKPAGRPNGIALSPNGRILYVANSDERNVRAYDLDKNGEASNERVLIAKSTACPAASAWTRRATSTSPAKGIAVYSPDGKPLHVIEIRATPPRTAASATPTSDALHHGAAPSIYRARLDVKGAY